MSISESKEESIALHNGTPFDSPQTDNALFYRVQSGTAYQFATEQLPSGGFSARYAVATYHAGDLILALPTAKHAGTQVHFVLTGALSTSITPVPFADLTNTAGKAAAENAMLAVRERLHHSGEEEASGVRSLLQQEYAEDAVRQYARDTANALAERRAADLDAEGVRFAARLRATDSVYNAALTRIGAVLDRQKLVAGEDTDASAVCRAAMLVARRDGIAVRTISGKSYNGTDALSELAKDSNIRLRAVALKRNWHRRDNGALFGYYAERTKRADTPAKPVALLPRKSGGYDCVEPESGSRIRIDAGNEENILPLAYMFYRPLETEPVTFKRLVQYCAHGIVGDVAMFLALGILSAIVGLLIPELTRMFMDTIIPQAAKNMAVQISALVLLCVLSAAVFNFVKALAMTRMETRSDSSLQAAVMDRLLKLPVGFFKDFTAGDLAQKTMAVSQIRSLVFGTVISSVMSLVFAMVYLLQLFRYSSYLLKWGTFFCLIPIALTAAVTLLKYRWNKHLVSMSSRISGTLFQFITGVNKLVMTASEKRAFAVWARLFAQQNEYTSKSEDLDIAYNTFTSLFSLAVTLAFYGIFMKAVASGKMDMLSTGSFMAFMASHAAFQGSLIEATGALTQSIQIVPLYKQAKVILQAEPEIQEAKPAVSRLSGAIEISHVSFRYSPDTPLILRDVSMKIEPGEFVAIVGGSGSGKSTLLRVLLGFEKAEQGSVFFDSQDLTALDVGSVRRNMGVVLQNSTIMQGSIFSNIVGSSALTLDDAWQAAEMAGLGDDIRGMPMGMHTMVSAGGGTLSGGQRQRLIIARAIARRPNILIFDEATSALDNRTQAQVSKSLESLKVTRIVIAHRLSTIINADRIYVLNYGVVEESGSYAELMAKGGFFAELAKRQQL